MFKRPYWLHWEVDGASGSTLEVFLDAQEALQYFNAAYAPFGYTLKQIERV